MRRSVFFAFVWSYADEMECCRSILDDLGISGFAPHTGKMCHFLSERKWIRTHILTFLVFPLAVLTGNAVVPYPICRKPFLASTCWDVQVMDSQEASDTCQDGEQQTTATRTKTTVTNNNSASIDDGVESPLPPLPPAAATIENQISATLAVLPSLPKRGFQCRCFFCYSKLACPPMPTDEGNIMVQ